MFCVEVISLLRGRRILGRDCLLLCGVVCLGSPFCSSDARGSVLFAFFHFFPNCFSIFTFLVVRRLWEFCCESSCGIGSSGFQIVWEVSWFKYDGLT